LAIGKCKSTFAKVFFVNPLQQPFRQTFYRQSFLPHGITKLKTIERIVGVDINRQ